MQASTNFCQMAYDRLQDPITNHKTYAKLVDLYDRETGDSLLHCIARAPATAQTNALFATVLDLIQYPQAGHARSDEDKYIRLNKVNANGDTPMHVAIVSNTPNLRLIETLLKHNVDLSIEDRYGRCPIHKAAMLGSTKILGLLLRAGDDPNRRNSAGNTPLHFTQAYNNDFSLRVVRYLVNQGRANTNIQNKVDGDTPMHLLARTHGNLKSLASMHGPGGADPNIKNRAGKSAYDLMLELNNTEYLEYFDRILAGTHKMYEAAPEHLRSPAAAVQDDDADDADDAEYRLDPNDPRRPGGAGAAGGPPKPSSSDVRHLLRSRQRVILRRSSGRKAFADYADPSAA